MSNEEEKNIIEGKKVPLIYFPKSSLGKFIFDTLSVRNVDYDAMVNAFTGQSISYDKILKDTCNLAEALRQYGCNSDTIISVCSENNLNYFTVVIASLYLGATVAPINHAYKEEELRHTLKLYRPKIVFCSLETIDLVSYLQLESEVVEKIILIDDYTSLYGIENINTFIERHLGRQLIDPKDFKLKKGLDPSKNVSFIMSSSETTGLPKRAMLTDRNILATIAYSMDPEISVQPIKNHMLLGLMPFFHAYGLNYALCSLLSKNKLIIFDRFDEDVFLKSLQVYEIETLAVTFDLAVFLTKSPKIRNYNFSSVKEIVCVASPIPKTLEVVLKRRLNISTIRQGYGLTEANLIVAMMRKSDISKPGSSGQVLPFVSLKIQDPKSGISLGPNQVGEICLKGPSVMKGYFKDTPANTFTGSRWLRTGDLGYYDEEKYIFVVDRLKDIIRYKGFQVVPVELEAILLNHPKILEAGVVGAPDKLAGEIPIAFVVKKRGVEVTEEDLIFTVQKKLPTHNKLRGGVIFLKAMPKTTTGKVMRKNLRKLVQPFKWFGESKL